MIERRRRGGVRRRRGLGGDCAPSPENCLFFSLEKAHFGGYLMHSDVLILIFKSWFAVCCAQDAARLCDQFCQFFSDGMQFMRA